MKRFSFGKVEVEVAERSAEPGFKEFLITVYAPGIDPFVFHSFLEAPSKDPKPELARNLMMNIRSAWRDPMSFIYHSTRAAIKYAKRGEKERAALRAKEEATEMARFAEALDPFMPEVEDELWRTAGVPRWGGPITRSPREWIPPRKVR